MDVETTANCTCLNLRKASRAVTKFYDDAFKPVGLRVTQFSLLAMVANRGPAGMKELAKLLVMDRTTLTRNLKPLIDQGFLEVIECDDRRQRPIAITSRGRNRLAKALPLWREAQNRVVANLGRETWVGLLQSLSATVSATTHE